MKTALLSTPIGILVIKGDINGLNSVNFSSENEINEILETPTELKDAVNQLQEYFNKKRTNFDLQLSPAGTDFQKRVWKELENIDYGKTKSYQEIANLLGDPKVIRAAASANGKNPIAIIIPCHRVIGSDGSLTGYSGGLERKKFLLEHENAIKQQSLF